MSDLADQTAVVTGASSGVGRAIALGLGERGTRLCLVGRNVRRLEEAAGHVRSKAPSVRCYPVDLLSDKEISEFAARIRDDVGQIDLLVHSAGILLMGKLGTAPVEDFDRQYKVNVRAPYLMTQMLLPLIRPEKGQIVFINSSAGVNARANIGQYSATKHALKAIADSLREEVNAQGIRVLTVYLGRTDSPMQEAVHQREGREYRPEFLIKPQEAAEMVIQTLGMPRSAEVTDIHIRPLRKL